MSPEEVTLHSEVSLLSCLDTGGLQKAALSSIMTLVQDAKKTSPKIFWRRVTEKGEETLSHAVWARPAAGAALAACKDITGKILRLDLELAKNPSMSSNLDNLVI